MTKCCLYICFILSIYFLISVEAQKKKCERCVLVDDCPLLKEKTMEEQKQLLEQLPCQGQYTAELNTPFGFSPVAKGDHICCPKENVWGIEEPEKPEHHLHNDNGNITNNHNDYDKFKGLDSGGNDDDSQKSSQNDSGDDSNEDDSSGDSGNYEQNKQPHFHRRPHRFHRTPWNNNNNPTSPLLTKPYGNYPDYKNPGNNYPNYNDPNVYGDYGNVPNGNINNHRPVDGGFGNGGQCAALSSFPPPPESGCCGREATTDEKITGPHNGYYNHPAPHNGYNNRPAPHNGYYNRPAPRPTPAPWAHEQEHPRPYYPWGRYKRSVDNEKANVSFDNRITGGRETELEQFPWTVLLKTTFDYGNKQAAFNCGGSLISARYVLTAAHCVTEENAKLTDVEVNLAEYDKRTFPLDCVHVPGVGKKCVTNIIVKGEEVVAHKEFDNKQLHNDIALIRLHERVPYTDFIRPICLPPINIDDPQFSDLRLAVAGWGRDGRFASQVKQSTVVNLVPHRTCSQAYPHLTFKHLCAAGHNGQDTCKGDSGGPLMMLYEGKYFVSGIVSGKRADSPCGTTVPSLYTNVYHYVDWIKSNIRE